MSVPTVLAMKDGKIVDSFVGLKTSDEVKEFVTQLLEE